MSNVHTWVCCLYIRQRNLLCGPGTLAAERSWEHSACPVIGVHRDPRLETSALVGAAGQMVR